MHPLLGREQLFLKKIGGSVFGGSVGRYFGESVIDGSVIIKLELKPLSLRERGWGEVIPGEEGGRESGEGV